MSSYWLSNIDYVVTHVDAGTLLFGDHDDAAYMPGITPTDVAVRSGDYLATLATRLDTISRRLTIANEPEHAELQKIIDELLAIDAKYEIKNKTR